MYRRTRRTSLSVRRIPRKRFTFSNRLRRMIRGVGLVALGFLIVVIATLSLTWIQNVWVFLFLVIISVILIVIGFKELRVRL